MEGEPPGEPLLFGSAVLGGRPPPRPPHLEGKPPRFSLTFCRLGAYNERQMKP
jgi:hypothetical protein